MKATPLPKSKRVKIWICPGCDEKHQDVDVPEEEFYEVESYLYDDSSWVRIGHNSVTGAYCHNCYEWRDVDDWQTFHAEWECSECDALYEDKEEADECCS